MGHIGILGGTFNPPHMGHLVMAQEALDQLDLERVVLLPVAVPPHKEAREDPGGAARVELCRLAVAGDEHLPEAILALAQLAVAEREGVRREDIARRLQPLHHGDRVVFFDMPRIDISSSAIRRRVAEGRPIRYLVPDAVAVAIAQHDLYRTAAGRPAA
jgi:nicotinate-nucleotide adenylyltransferase